MARLGASREPESEGIRSVMSGEAENVVQAASIAGGVHFYQARGARMPLPRQLPGDVRGFVNRTADIQRLDAMRSDDGLTTATSCVVVGTAGVGKTSFVVHWAHRVRDQFPDGQLYVNLRGYDRDAPITALQALDRFLLALGVQPETIPTDPDARTDLYRSLLADRRILVVLDNAASEGQVRALLPGSPSCFTLITSRSRLSGLMARDGAHRLALELFPEEESVALVNSVTAGYRSGDALDEVAELADLCARLPLALRIAAERAASRPMMPLGDLIRDLRDESMLWDALSTDGDEAAAVHSVFAWSYRTLSRDAARLFCLLGLLPSPSFGVGSTAALAGLPEPVARRLLDTLVGSHLLEQVKHDWYQFHDLLRAYAINRARLEITDEDRRAVLERVFVWYLNTADAATCVLNPHDHRLLALPAPAGIEAPAFETGTEALRWCTTEMENMAGVVRAAATAGNDDIAWRLPATLRSAFDMSNRFSEWIAMTEQGLASAERLRQSEGQALLLHSLGMAHVQSNRVDKAIEFHEAAFEMFQNAGNVDGACMVLNGIGLALWRAHRLREAAEAFTRGLNASAACDGPYWTGATLLNLGMADCDLGKLTEGVASLREALAIYEAMDDSEMLNACWLEQGRAARAGGDLRGALSLVEQALADARSREASVGEGYTLLELGQTQLMAGLFEPAIASFQLAATIHRQIGDRSREAAGWTGIGDVYSAAGRHAEAIGLYRQAAAVFWEVGDNWRLGRALDGLAVALCAIGSTEEAALNWQDALYRFADFDDPATVETRDRIVGILTNSGY